jgi:methionyl-tRNA formyltransferase
MVMPMRIIFLGTPEFAVPPLRALIRSRYEVCAVFTQPDRPSGRGQALHPPPVKVLAREHGIPVYQPLKIRSEENKPLIKDLNPDFLVVAAFGQILPPWLLQSARLSPVNIHPSLLPQYRGAAPVTWAVLNGDAMTGVTTMEMNEGLDTGPILLQREFPLPDSMTGGELEAALSEIGASLLLETLDGIDNGTVRPTPQDDSLASSTARITKEMGLLDWSQDSVSLHNRIRALHPWPLCYSNFRGERIQILRARPCPAILEPERAPGAYFGLTADGILIQCGAGSVLEVLQVQLPSKRPVSGRGFAAGARLKPDDHEIIFRS